MYTNMHLKPKSNRIKSNQLSYNASLNRFFLKCSNTDTDRRNTLSARLNKFDFISKELRCACNI